VYWVSPHLDLIHPSDGCRVAFPMRWPRAVGARPPRRGIGSARSAASSSGRRRPTAPRSRSVSRREVLTLGLPDGASEVEERQRSARAPRRVTAPSRPLPLPSSTRHGGLPEAPGRAAQSSPWRAIPWWSSAADRPG
jgi:hypothetical protein